MVKNIITLIIASTYLSSSICFASPTLASNTKQPSATNFVPAPTEMTIEFIEILNAWARGSNTSNNSAIYLEIHNNSDTDYNLVNVSSEVANKVELHNSFVDEKGVSQMKKLDKLVIPAKTNVILQPASMHIMLLDLRNTLKIGDKFALSLYFDKALTSDKNAPAGNMTKTIEVEVKNK